MQLPVLRSISHSQTAVTTFGGYNATESCAEGEFAHQKNLSARCWPALAPRLPRRLLTSLEKPHGLYAKNGLIWVDGETLYYNGAAVGTVADSDKTFCGIGSRVLIWPDKLMLDTADSTLKPLGAVWQATGQVRFAPARPDGTEYTVAFTGPETPESPANGDYWLDTSGESDVLRVYSAAGESWAAVSAPYVRIASPGIGQQFVLYDTVTISGISNAVLGNCADDLNADCVVWGRGDDYLLVTGLVQKAAVQQPEQGEIRVERRIPDLDFLTECDNRVWGVAKNGHEILACKLGDPTNWYSYMGTAADSYAVSVGSDGAFTGAATCMGYVLLFKQSLMHRVYGSKPENFQVVTVPCPGVKDGCAGSLANVDSTLYYWSDQGVMACDGGLPEPVGKALGSTPAGAAAAGGGNGLYYLALQRADGRHLFCLDTARRLWHRQDDIAARWFAQNGADTLFLTEDGQLWVAGSETAAALGGEEEAAFDWLAETGDLELRTMNHKFVTRLQLRLTMQAGAAVRLAVQYDSDGVWRPAGTLTAAARRDAVIPLLPRRCNHLRLRIIGRGQVTVHALARVFAKGSEL
ncbi:MAG: hypothetical protein IJ347_01670 [Faecalibacterium sp.]|nr:hypothetical protein [Faecalibacterium sp.]